jgi:UDP-N-acetylenolpyruvoylglucosamine reductase
MKRNLKITTAHAVLELIPLLKAQAREARGIELHTEVEIIGEEIV